MPVAEVLRRAQSAEGIETIVASMTVAYKVMRETFTSRVTLDRANLQILVEYLRRAVQPNGEPVGFSPDRANRSCDVEFFISYEFKSRVLGMLMGAMFETAFRRFAEAFERRADAVYGRVSTS